MRAFCFPRACAAGLEWSPVRNKRATTVGLEPRPACGKPAIKLDAWSAEVNHLIQSECRINAATQWLFKIGRDGDAPEVLGGCVRSGEQYVLVRMSDAPADDGFKAFDKEKIACGGVVA